MNQVNRNIMCNVLSEKRLRVKNENFLALLRIFIKVLITGNFYKRSENF